MKYFKDKNYDLVRDDVKAVVEAANGTLVKVILETCLLTEDEIKIINERLLGNTTLKKYFSKKMVLP